MTLGDLGEMRFVIEVTRKDTGAVEFYEMVDNILGGEEEEGK